VKTRPLHVAEADWRRISLELRMFDRPEGEEEAASSISIREQIRRRTVVSDKWIFNTRE
jgi:hypothetical protein